MKTVLSNFAPQRSHVCEKALAHTRTSLRTAEHYITRTSQQMQSYFTHHIVLALAPVNEQRCVEETHGMHKQSVARKEYKTNGPQWF